MLELRVARKFLHLYKSAKSRNIDFDLSLSDVKELLNQNACQYTGKVLVDNTPKDGEQPLYNYRSIERIDGDVGYTKNNVISVCYGINSNRSDLSIEEIKKYALIFNEIELLNIKELISYLDEISHKCKLNIYEIKCIHKFLEERGY